MGEEVCDKVTRDVFSVPVNLCQHEIIPKAQTGGMASDRKGRRRSDYVYFLSYRTRWFVIPTRAVALQGELSLSTDSGATTTNIHT